MNAGSSICAVQSWFYLSLRSLQEVQTVFTYNRMSHQPSLTKWVIALIFEVDFTVHHPLLPPLSSPMRYTVLLGESQGCGSKSLESLVPTVFLFILLAPTQQHTGENICSYLYLQHHKKLYLKYSLVFLDPVTADWAVCEVFSLASLIL